MATAALYSNDRLVAVGQPTRESSSMASLLDSLSNGSVDSPPAISPHSRTSVGLR